MASKLDFFKYFSQNIQPNNPITIQDVIFDEQINFDPNFKIDRQVAIYNCEFKKGFKFNNEVECRKAFLFDTCIFSSLDIQDCEFLDNLNILNSPICCDVQIDNAVWKNLHFRFKNINTFTVQNSTFKTLSISSKNDTSYHLTINCNNNDGDIVIDNQKLTNLDIKGNNLRSMIKVSNLTCDKVSFQDFTNNGILKIFGLKPENNENTEFSVVESILGKSILTGIEFNKFNKVIFRKSQLTETVISNSTWKKGTFNLFTNNEQKYSPLERGLFFLNKDQHEILEKKYEKILEQLLKFNVNFRKLKIYLRQPKNVKIELDKLIDSFNEVNASIQKHKDKKEVLGEMKDVFMQLKYIYQKQGDAELASRFYSFEMDAYFLLISWRNDFSSKLILFLSKQLSNYGRSIIRPFLGLIYSNLIFFVILIYFFNYHGLKFVNPFMNDFNASFLAIGEYAMLLNPLRKFDNSLEGLEIVIDLLSRVASSFFVYALIRASRRFVR